MVGASAFILGVDCFTRAGLKVKLPVLRLFTSQILMDMSGILCLQSRFQRPIPSIFKQALSSHPNYAN